MLTRRYGEITALDALTLQVPTGSIFGFLGPNGAGKTTTIRLLLGFIRPTGGVARIAGHDCWSDGVAARQQLGFLVQPDALYPEMTGEDQLDYAAHLSAREPILRDRVLDVLELEREALGRKLGQYSKGMRQKLALTAAMQHDPDLLILDEPTDGLDPLIRRNFEELLRERNRAGRTIFMSSHDLAEVERTCQLVAVVRDGKLVAQETVTGLQRRHLRRAEVTFAGAIPPGLDAIAGITLAGVEGSTATLLLEGDLDPLLRFLAGHHVADLTLAPPSLDDIFLGFYGRDRGMTP